VIRRLVARIDAAVDAALLGPPPDYSRRGGRPAAPGVDLDALLARYLPADPRDTHDRQNAVEA